MKASALRSGSRLHLTTTRSIHSKLLPPPRTKAKIYISQIWKLASPQIAFCEQIRLPSKPSQNVQPTDSAGANLTLAYGRRYGLIGRNGRFNLWGTLT